MCAVGSSGGPTSASVLSPQRVQLGLGVEKGSEDLVTDINDAPGEEGSCAVHADSVVNLRNGSPALLVHEATGSRDRQERRSGRHCLHLCPHDVHWIEKCTDERAQKCSCRSGETGIVRTPTRDIGQENIVTDQ